MIRSICERCKFAEWARTRNGRLNPNKQGKCTWTKTFHIAGSAARPGTWGHFGEPLTVTGGRVERGSAWPSKCDVFQEIER